MKKTIVIFERGILGWESVFGAWQWPHAAVVWVHENTEFKAQTITYFNGFIFPAITRWYRAKQFAKLITAYSKAGWRIVMVCHSEGTATGLRALRDANWPTIDELHLVNGAADSDCQANGLNMALINRKVGKAFIYVATNDKAMRLENTYIGSLCFGLQTAGEPIGLNGPTNVIPTARVHMEVIKWQGYGHSTCWDDTHIEGTLRQLVRK